MAPGVSPAPTGTTAIAGTATIRVEPSSARLDEPFRVTASGLPPGRPVTIRASTRDGELREWGSHATFVADAEGALDLGTQQPQSGTYDGVDATGLLWSMRPTAGSTRVFFVRRKPSPLHVAVAAEVDGRTVATCTAERTFGAAQVRRRFVDALGLVGDLFYPKEEGPHPGALVLSGSDGGQLDQAASLLAAHGYAVLSLGYVGLEDRPSKLNNIELEYFGTALRWMADQPEIAGERVTVIGLSRGAELALQLGSMFPQVAAVVAGAPSGIRQAGLTRKTTDLTKPAWTFGGTPLAFVPGRGLSLRMFLDFYAVFVFRRPVRLRPTFERLMRRRDVVARATIEVERIEGPVMLISGTDDQLWPSGWFAAQIMQRLRDSGHHYPDEHLSYEGAGHFLCFPYGLASMPPMTKMSPVAALTMDFGGTALANAAAARDSWPEILRFLAQVSAG